MEVEKLNVYDSNLELLDQPDFPNIPKTPLWKKFTCGQYDENPPHSYNI